MEKITFKLLTKELLGVYLSELIKIDQQAFKAESWDAQAFNFSLPAKFEKSFVVFEKNKLIAFSINSMKEDFCHIHRIVVEDHYKSKGLGKKMIYFIENELKQKKISLKVNVNNIFAINFYFGLNFKIKSVQNEYYTMKIE
jgi:ribosomal protein S18 acetylase RimI-like enzyme